MSGNPEWFDQRVLDGLNIPLWVERLRPVLQDIGPDAAAAFLLFDRRAPIVVPGPQFSPDAARHLLGLVPFAPDGGSPFSYNPACHILRVDVGDQKICLFSLLGPQLEELEAFVDDYRHNARASMVAHGPVMDQMAVFYISAQPPT